MWDCQCSCFMDRVGQGCVRVHTLFGFQDKLCQMLLDPSVLVPVSVIVGMPGLRRLGAVIMAAGKKPVSGGVQGVNETCLDGPRLFGGSYLLTFTVA